VKITNENQILDEGYRAKLIQEIEQSENKSRKYEAYKRYQCYKDGTNHYVMSLLMRQFEQSTVEEMRYALSNISIIRKVIDKLARVYSNGVVREISGDEEATKKLKQIEKVLCLNDKLKTTNRFLKLHKNTALFVKPYPLADDPSKYAITLEVLQPYLYDVLESEYNRTQAVCFIHSDYTHPSTDLADLDTNSLKISGNNVDEVIANVANDKGAGLFNNKKYVFWSKNYHFTTDSNGKIISQEAPRSVLRSSNHINFAIDQDGNFWAIGGNDLIDGAIMINAVITHTQHVGVNQGYGQFYMTGENLPRSLKVGVNKAIIAEYKKDEQAEPKLGFLSANPQLDALRALIEMYIALYLTTNNLSTSGVSTQLGSGTSMASGIALILDKAESLEDVQDQRQVFIDNEVKIIKAVNETLKAFNSALSDEFKDLILPDDFEKKYVVKFNDAQAIQTEGEKLANMKLRRELGLDTRLAMIMRDDPALNEEQAEEKLLKMIEQEIKEKQLEIQAAKDAGLDNVVSVDGEEEGAVEDANEEDAEDSEEEDDLENENN
jgi:hypothetical protein